jgi:hypothetical protein
LAAPSSITSFGAAHTWVAIKQETVAMLKSVTISLDVFFISFILPTLIFLESPTFSYSYLVDNLKVDNNVIGNPALP